MNKQELIKEFREVGIYSLNIFGTEIKAIPTEIAITLIEQLDEQKPVKVPQFVADWIERSKQEKRNLRNALNNGGEKMHLWFLDQENYDLFARAWLDGYEVEKEKRYTVIVKGNIKENMLVYGKAIERYFFTKSYTLTNANYAHTRKELEEANFGWVFDCEGVEVEEAE